MTTTDCTPVFEYRHAKKIADRVVEILSPYTDIIHIAGSVRRECTHVKDIEVVCIPKKVFIASDLFGGGNWVLYQSFIDAVNYMKSEVIKGSFHGRYMQIMLKGNIKLDLFTPIADDLYRQLTIRTGPAEFSSKIIAHGWSALGWCGTNMGLRRKQDCVAKRNHEGKIVSWECVNNNGEHPPAWKSEESFFEWLGIRWVEPRYR